MYPLDTAVSHHLHRMNLLHISAVHYVWLPGLQLLLLLLLVQLLTVQCSSLPLLLVAPLIPACAQCICSGMHTVVGILQHHWKKSKQGDAEHLTNYAYFHCSYYESVLTDTLCGTCYHHKEC
jgi:hypothetical protein